MVLVLPSFPDIEKVVMALLDRDVPELAEKSGTELPDSQAMPYARVARIGGRRNRLKDYPIVDIEVFAEGTAGKSLVEAIDVALFQYPDGVAVGTKFVKIEDVQVRSSLARRPWEDDRVRRYGVTYQLTVSRS
jgi:hypothetical protein